MTAPIRFRMWNDAKVWAGSEDQKCYKCRERILVGQWSKQHRVSGHVYHDDCAEDVGAYVN